MIDIDLPDADTVPVLVRSFAAWMAAASETPIAEVPLPGDPHPGASAQNTTVVLMFGTPSGVVLSPQDPDLLGRAAADLPIRVGYVVSGLDPASLTSAGTPLPNSTARSR